MLNTTDARTLAAVKQTLNTGEVGGWMYSLIERLYPICRSITGNGVRQTLGILKTFIDLDVVEVPTGTPVLDLTVPREWNIADAYIKNRRGERVVDFQRHNLHVLNYSTPIYVTMPLAELQPHLYTLPDYPDWIPYRTSYYAENWGFCLTQRQYDALTDDEYEVRIDSTLEPGSLTYGEYFIQGESSDEFLISCHVCHPALCNDNLSGIALATRLAKTLSETPPRYSYRFLFIPGTIGSITWLAAHEKDVDRIRHGLVLTCVGDPGTITYKRSRRGDAEIDRAMACLLAHAETPSTILDFYPYGYDERQYCSPGFNLPVGVLMRSKHGAFPEYHTSADDLDLVQPAFLADSFLTCLDLVEMIENNRTYRNLSPKGEPQLGRRGIYKAISGQQSVGFDQMALLWVLNLSDGDHSLLDIAERSGIAFDQIARAAALLAENDLLQDLSLSR